MPYHVRIAQPGGRDIFALDLDEDDLRARVVDPWLRGQTLRLEGAGPRVASDSAITVTRTDVSAAEIMNAAHSPRAETRAAKLAVMRSGDDVTNDYLRVRPDNGQSLCGETPHELVVRICRDFPRLVQAMRTRHSDRRPLEINDEYDVQYVIGGVLSLFFRDVRSEEPAPSHAALRPKLDFLLPEEGIVVECKMTREGLGDQKLVKELTEDFEHYRSHPSCRYVIALVYDPGKRLSKPTQLQKDLSGDRGGIETRVVIAS